MFKENRVVYEVIKTNLCYICSVESLGWIHNVNGACHFSADPLMWRSQTLYQTYNNNKKKETSSLKESYK